MSDIDFDDLEFLDQKVHDLCEYIKTYNGLEVLACDEHQPNEVRSLNLANTGITSISQWMFLEIPNLEVLDLSHNMLKEMSNMEDIDLPQLKKLNLSQNNISDFTFLRGFQSLEELNISGNSYDITVPYWAVTNFPKLKRFNGEDVTEIRKYISMAEMQVITNIEKLFNENFTQTLDETQSGIMKMKSNFTENLLRECGVCNKAKSALKPKVEQFVDNKLKDLLREITEKVSSRSVTNNIQMKTTVDKSNISENSNKHLMKTIKMTKSKEPNDPEVDVLAEAIAQAIGDLSVQTNITSRSKSCIRESDSKTRDKQLNKTRQQNDDRLKRRHSETHIKSSNEPNCDLSLQINTTSRSKSSTRVSDNELLKTSQQNDNRLKRRQSETHIIRSNDNQSNCGPSYDLIHTLREHSQKCGSNNTSTPIWDIRFKPKSRRYSGNELVATCGGNVVNIIDLKSGYVMKRFEDMNPLETFNCIEWRDFVINTRNGKTREISLLVIGGTKKNSKHSSIVFLNENNMNDFIKIASHVKSVNSLLFHPKRRNHLFSGGSDRKIILWDIDWTQMTWTSMLSSMNAKKVLEIDINNKILSLVFSVQFNVLITAGENGIFLVKEPYNNQEKHIRSIELPDKTKLVDGLALIEEKPNLMAFRYKQRIIIADLEKMMALMKFKDSKALPLLPVTQLRYSQQKCDYFYLSVESGLMSCGDASGHIFLYELNDSVLSTTNTNLIEPKEVLSMPHKRSNNNKQQLVIERPVFVNIAAISPNHEYIVSGTNTNLICIWHKRHVFKIPKRLKSG